MKSRRALLYMPGDDWKKIVKSITLGVDSICMDMEDGVDVNKKTEASGTIARALRELDFGNSEKLARINAVGSRMELDDIQAVLPFHPDGIVIPPMTTPILLPTPAGPIPPWTLLKLIVELVPKVGAEKAS